MNTSFVLCTDAGLFDIDGTRRNNGDASFEAEDAPIRAAAMADGSLYLIAGDSAVYRVDDTHVELLAHTRERANCVEVVGDDVLVGTAKAGLERVAEGGTESVVSFADVEGRDEWNTPWGGPPDVRSLAVSADGAVFADIHVGWITRSIDGGVTWESCRNGLEKDVHQVATHPDHREIVFAATARGFYLSEDCGLTFERRSEPMPYYYQRACAVIPGTDTYLVSTSRGPHGQADALVFRSEDAGATWTRVAGIPDGVSENIDTFHLAADRDGRVLAVVEGAELYLSEDFGATFRHAGTSPAAVHAVLSA